MADGAQDDVVSARRLYAEWDEGRGTPKSEIERREWDDSGANGRRFDRFVFQHLGVKTSRRKKNTDRLPEFPVETPPTFQDTTEGAGGADPAGPTTPNQQRERARAACLVALKAWNDTELTFRTEAFITPFLTAWNGLALAMLQRDGVEWRVVKDGKPVRRGGAERPLDVITLVDLAFSGEENAGLRQNLRFWVDVRGAVADRSLPALDLPAAPYVQAGLVNFERQLIDEFGAAHRLGQYLSVPLPLESPSPPASGAGSAAGLPLEVQAVLNRAELTTPELIADPTFMLRVSLTPLTPLSDSAAGERPSLGARQVVEAVRGRIPYRFSINDHGAVARFFGVRPSRGQPDRSLDERYCEYLTSYKVYLFNQLWVDRVVQQLSTEAGYRQAVGREPTSA